MLETQRLATSVVAAVIDDGRNLNAALAAALARHPDLVSSQRATITDLTYGTLRFGMQLDAVLDRLLTAPLRDRTLRRLLLVALYQLQYTRAAPYAVVDHAVRCAAALGAPRAKTLVNAVLRNFLRQREALLAQSAQKETARYAYPQWWIEKLRAQYPQHYASALLAGNTHPPFTLRVNGRRIARDAYLALLAQHQIAAAAVGDRGVRLERALPVERVPGFDAGLASVQDAGAQLAAPLLDARDGMRVLDACAAPGGKTTHLLELADLDLTALDCDAARLERVQQNLARLGLSAKLICGDAGRPETWWDGRPFDRILADVPCSASGVVRRHPDIKWLRRAADIAQFASRQRALLDVLWRLLASGGKLLYTTCSVFQEENAQQIADFLACHPDANLLPWSGIPAPAGAPEGQLLPDHEHDGFFYALLQKI
ncbi:MAG TPA: 16S rRNA (cytosine(967)-C(5))-methyltransferase RsmB [Burkholderiales bacterium]|nr:16S rRNA (cytosine(967)-C(5))-methyltransferase RsmB [Burkholderiales bacterium]